METMEAKKPKLQIVPLTNSKPSASGFEFEEEKRWSKGVNQPGLKAQDDLRKLLYRFDDRSSYEERKGNALASGADEGRDKLR